MPRQASSSSSDPADLIKQAIAGLDAQIRDWTTKRDQLAKLLPSGGGAAFAVRRRGRPPGSKNKAAATATSTSSKPKRKVSAATRKKLKAAAQARWAKIKEEQAGA